MYNVFQPRTVCKFNQRGMCRFGTRCWHIHQEPNSNVQEPERNATPQQEEEPTQGACALSPSKPKEEKINFYQNNYGPSTSSVEEAISLVKISESEDKICGICFDNILKKDNRADQKFGILPNCNHCYCFTCLRKWRKSKEYESGVSKSCPECRIVSEANQLIFHKYKHQKQQFYTKIQPSYITYSVGEFCSFDELVSCNMGRRLFKFKYEDFVFPSKIWITSKEEKDTFIDNQRKKMKQKDCSYFRKGKGKCPFGNTCLYLHALPNGKVLDVGPPRPRRTPGAAAALESEADMLQQILFWINDDDIESDDDFDDCILDLDDPCIAMQYYDRGDIRRYIAMNRLMNGSDDDDDDIDMIF